MVRKILVTGATSGIGRACAEHFLNRGDHVALLGRRESLLSAIAAPFGERALCLPCDLSDRGSTDRALAVLKERWSSLFGLVLNAGDSTLSPLDEPRGHSFDRLIELNLVSVMRTVRGLLPILEEDGRVVAIGFVVGRFGIPAGHGYCASKAGLAGFCRALALDLAPRRITVNCVQPGWVETDLAKSAIASQGPTMGMDPGTATSFFKGLVPLRRFLEPSEIAATVTWLFEPGAAGITGQALNQCAGALA